MKKSTTLFLGLSLLMVTATSAFAESVSGQVQSINNTTNEIVVRDVSGKEKMIIVHPKIILTLQPGSLVNIALKSGTNAADTVEVQIV